MILILLVLVSVSALDLERLLKTIRESSSGLSHKYNRTFLNISGLGIETLGSGLFEHFGDLTHLDVSLNDIRHVDDLAFYGLRNLRAIDLSHNSGLYTVSHQSLLPLEKLEEINVDATHISSLPANVFKHNKHLRRISLNTPFIICDCDLQKLAQRSNFDEESRCLYPIKLRGSPVRALKDAPNVCKASTDLQMRVINSKRERSMGGSYWNIDCSVNNTPGHIIEIKLDGRPLHNLDGHFTVTERRHHDRHHIILHVIENFVPFHPWICYAEVNGASDAKPFYIPASCQEETILNGTREVTFPRTPPDTILETRCPNSSAILSRECSMAGVWSSVDISLCPETADSCDIAVNSDSIDGYLRNASACPRGRVLSKIDSLAEASVASDLLTLCSLTTVDGDERNRAGLARDRRGRWKCALDPAEPVVVITQRSFDRNPIKKYKIARLDISTMESFLPNAFSSEIFGLAVSDVPSRTTEATISLNYTTLDGFGSPVLYRLCKDGAWRKISPSYCKIRSSFGATVQVSCSSRLLSSSSDFCLLGIAPSCDVTKDALRRAALTTKIIVALSSLLFLATSITPLTRSGPDAESILRNASTIMFLIAIVLRTFSPLSAHTTNQMTHAGLIHHLLICLLSKQGSTCLTALSLVSFTFFLALSVPPITDHLASGRIYVTPASRLSAALLTPSADTLVLLIPIIFLVLLCLADNRGSQFWLILSPFAWLLALLSRVAETCDLIKTSTLDALLVIIPLAHVVLSLRAHQGSKKDALSKSHVFHHHISFTEEETSLY